MQIELAQTKRSYDACTYMVDSMTSYKSTTQLYFKYTTTPTLQPYDVQASLCVANAEDEEQFDRLRKKRRKTSEAPTKEG